MLHHVAQSLRPLRLLLWAYGSCESQPHTTNPKPTCYINSLLGLYKEGFLDELGY